MTHDGRFRIRKLFKKIGRLTEKGVDVLPGGGGFVAGRGRIFAGSDRIITLPSSITI